MSIMLHTFVAYNQNLNDMEEEYKYLLVYDDYVDIEGMDEEEAEEHMTDLAYTYAFDAKDLLNTYCWQLLQKSPFTRDIMLSDEFKKRLEHIKVLVEVVVSNFLINSILSIYLLSVPDTRGRWSP